MRLDKYVATVTELSRTEAKGAIKRGRIHVAGELATDPRHEVSANAAITLDREPLRAATHRYFMLNKPKGYVSAAKDRQHMTVLELLDEDNCDQLHIAGRLDIDTTGLVLLTDDGQWSHRVTSPKSDCKKTYRLETADPIAKSAAENFSQGIHLDNEKRPTLPAVLDLIDEQTARLTIREGKYHQVKRMFAALGNRVEELHRERIGEIVLDDDLYPGEYRLLTEEEVASV